MPDMSDLIPFLDRTRWLMFKACAAEGVDLKNFSRDLGMAESRIRDILFSDKADIGDLNIRQIAEWFYCSVGRTPEFSIVPRSGWHSTDRPA